MDVCWLGYVILIIASEDAFFADPVVRMGIPGVEYFAHPYELNPRIAKEFLFLGERMSSSRAYEMGMVNKVVPIERLESTVMDMAKKISAMPRLGLTLTKQAINHVEDLQEKEMEWKLRLHGIIFPMLTMT